MEITPESIAQKMLETQNHLFETENLLRNLRNLKRLLAHRDLVRRATAAAEKANTEELRKEIIFSVRHTIGVKSWIEDGRTMRRDFNPTDFDESIAKFAAAVGL